MINDLSVLLYSAAFVVCMMFALLTTIGIRPHRHQWEIVATYLLWATIAATRAVLVERANLYWEFVYIGRILWLLLLILYTKILIRYIITARTSNKK